MFKTSPDPVGLGSSAWDTLRCLPHKSPQLPFLSLPESEIMRPKSPVSVGSWLKAVENISMAPQLLKVGDFCISILSLSSWLLASASFFLGVNFAASGLNLGIVMSQFSRQVFSVQLRHQETLEDSLWPWFWPPLTRMSPEYDSCSNQSSWLCGIPGLISKHSQKANNSFLHSSCPESYLLYGNSRNSDEKGETSWDSKTEMRWTSFSEFSIYHFIYKQS